MLPQNNRLKARRDFRRIYQKGRALPMPAFVLYYRRNNLTEFRVGFSVSKKIGNAVIRNRVKRRLRAACREQSALFKPGYDYIFIARQGGKNINYTKLCQQIAKAFVKIKDAKA